MNAFLRALAALCLIRAGVSQLLPEGGTRAIMDFALGLMETLCILRLLIDLIRGAL
jgi:hypothetical protein